MRERFSSRPLAIARRAVAVWVAFGIGAALTAGVARGQEAAALRIYTHDYPDQSFFPLDIRVDSHDTPLQELRRLYDVFLQIDRRVIV